MKARAAEAAQHAETAALEAENKAVDTAQKAKDAADHAAATAVADARATATAAKVAATGAVHETAPSEGSTVQWAKWLADQLRQVPDIQVYDALRLNDLAAKGPIRARAVWTTAQAVLGKDYGSVTVADLLKRFQS